MIPVKADLLKHILEFIRTGDGGFSELTIHRYSDVAGPFALGEILEEWRETEQGLIKSEPPFDTEFNYPHAMFYVAADESFVAVGTVATSRGGGGGHGYTVKRDSGKISLLPVPGSVWIS